MGMRIEGGGHYTDVACTYPDEEAARTPSARNRDAAACSRAIVEEAISEAACVGSALWTAGSLASLLGAIGGAVATVAACSYAALKSRDTEHACRIEAEPPNPELMWSLDSM